MGTCPVGLFDTRSALAKPSTPDSGKKDIERLIFFGRWHTGGPLGFVQIQAVIAGLSGKNEEINAVRFYNLQE